MFQPLPVVLTAICLLAVCALLVADRFDHPPGRVVGKLAASTAFVAVALALGAYRGLYGQLILGALLLGWLGDAFLLSRAAKAFLGGLAAFLLSHLLFAGAFMTAGVSTGAMGVAAVLAVLFGAGVLRWLLPHVPGEMRLPVLAYVAVILLMCIAAAGHAAASGRWAVLAGAVLFTASDLSVARDRFVQPAFVNRLWGWPTYFAAQLVLAWTVATAPSLG